MTIKEVGDLFCKTDKGKRIWFLMLITPHLIGRTYEEILELENILDIKIMTDGQRERYNNSLGH